MKVIYNILNNEYNLIVEQFYHTICDPDLYKSFCAIRRIPCSCTGCVEQLSNTWLPNLDKTLQPHYAIEPKTFKYYSILWGYNKNYIANLTF